MFAYMFVHLTFRAPQVVIWAHMCTNVYLTVHLLERQKYFREKVNLRSIPLTIDPKPSFGIHTVFYRERNNRRVSCLPRIKQPDNFQPIVFESNKHGQFFSVFDGLRQQGCW